MADLRFKINGTSSPFITEVYKTSDDSLVCTQPAEYKGADTVGRDNHTCVIINDLKELTSYYVKVTDSLGRTTASIPMPDTPKNPVYKSIIRNIQLLGSNWKVSYAALCTEMWLPEGVVDGKGGKCIRFDPPLGDGECVRVCLCGEACVDSGLDTSLVKVWKRTSPSASYSLKCEINSDDDYFTIDIGPNETVCYEGCVIIGQHTTPATYNPTACIAIIGTTKSVGSSNIDAFTCNAVPDGGDGKTEIELSQTCSVAATTTTTSNTPYKVYFGATRPLYGDCTIQAGTKLYVDPPLPEIGTQSFRVHIFMETYYTHSRALNQEIQQEGLILTKGANTGNLVTNTGDFSQTTYTRTKTITKTITEDTIDWHTFRVCACDALVNNAIPHSQYTCMCICKIDQGVGGTYSFGGAMPQGGQQGFSVSTSAVGEADLPYVPISKFDRFTDLNDGPIEEDQLPSQL